MKSHPIAETFTTSFAPLKELIDYTSREIGVSLTERDIMQLGLEPQAALPIYAVSHDFVMIEAFEHDARFFKGSKRLGKTERRLAQRSYGRGELYQLHPDFVKRLLNTGILHSNDFPPHTITHASSTRRLTGWNERTDPITGETCWNKSIASVIYQPEGSFPIRFSDIRVDRRALLNRLMHEKPVANTTETAPSQDWITRVQAEAAARWLREIDMGASPTKNRIKDDLAVWCRKIGVQTQHNVFPSASYIARHALRQWTPPAPKTRPSDG